MCGTSSVLYVLKTRQTCSFWPDQQVGKFSNQVTFLAKAEHTTKTKRLPPNYPDAESGSHRSGFTARKSRTA